MGYVQRASFPWPQAWVLPLVQEITPELDPAFSQETAGRVCLTRCPTLARSGGPEGDCLPVLLSAGRRLGGPEGRPVPPNVLQFFGGLPFFPRRLPLHLLLPHTQSSQPLSRSLAGSPRSDTGGPPSAHPHSFELSLHSSFCVLSAEGPKGSWANAF